MKTQSTARAAQAIARLMAALALSLVLAGSPSATTPAHAFNLINVDTTDGGLITSDSKCSLAEAIGNAESDSALYPECSAGAGADTIAFDNALGTATITLTAALPGIFDTDGLTIMGGGDITVDGADTYQIFYAAAPLTLFGLTVAHGKAVTGGAAIVVGHLTIVDSSFVNNRTAGSDSIASGGGAIFNSQGTLTISGSTFSGNSTVAQGGAIYVCGGTTDITNSTFSANSAAGGTAGNRGGAIFNFGCTLPSGVISIYDSTFSGNSADSGFGADIHLRVEDTVNLYNTILANSPAGGSCFSPGGGTFSASNNLVEDATLACGMWDTNNGNIVGHDPGLGSSAGSPAHFPLNTGSLAIDAGANAHVPGGVTTDQAGQPRFFNNGLVLDKGTGTSPIVDIGSFEDQSNACPSSAQIYVDGGMSGGTHNGDSWANAVDDLQQGLTWDQGCPGATATWVKEGVYVPGSSDSDSFVVPSGVQVYGGFAGTESNLSQRNWVTHPTILSGDIGGDDDSGNADGNSITENASEISGTNSSNIVRMVQVDGSTVLDGFTITGGQAHIGFGDGGGLWCDGQGPGGVCNPVLSHLLFSGNTANYGGAVFNYGYNVGDSSPTITDVTFVGNHADQEGGAIFNYGFLGASSPTLNRVTFESNDALNGGAMGNLVGSSGTSSPVINNATFFDNLATGNGGAVYNRALNSGAVVSPEFTNVTFSQNSAAHGGAMYNFGESGGSSTPVLVNTILWGDSAGTGPEIENNASTSSLSYSVVEGGCGAITGASCGAGMLSTDPHLGALANNGGETKTMALLAGSSAIETGQNSGAPAKDQRGHNRPLDSDGNGTATVEIGAFEVDAKATFRSTGSLDGWLLESSETSGKAGTSDAAGTSFYLGDNAARKQYRGILSFDTSTLPDTAVITGVTLKIKKAGLVGANPFLSLGNIVVDIKKGSWSGNPALQLTDFYAAGTKNYAAQINNSPVGSWYSTTLGPTTLGYFSLTGPTQIRLRFATDDNNNAVADYLKFGSGNASTASRPQLIITFYLP